MQQDTRPEAQAVQVDIFRKMSGERRLLQMFGASEDARALTIAGLRHAHPLAAQEELLRMERRNRLGTTLADAAWSSTDRRCP